MKIIAIERELKPVPADTAADLYRAEAKQVFTLYKQDILRDIHMTEARCAILTLECESIDAANRALATLPLVQGGYISFEVHSLSPYPGYGRLMSE